MSGHFELMGQKKGQDSARPIGKITLEEGDQEQKT
jgi:hypothetical protein